MVTRKIMAEGDKHNEKEYSSKIPKGYSSLYYLWKHI